MTEQRSSGSGWKTLLLALGGTALLARHWRRRGDAIRPDTEARLRLP